MDHTLINGARGTMVAVADRGFAYGDGVFETIAVRNGAPRFPGYHFDRLLAGCDRLGIVAPLREIEDDIGTAVAGQPCGTLKVVVTRGTGPRGYRPPRGGTPTRIVGFTPDSPGDTSASTGAVPVMFCTTPVACSPATAGLKVLGRVENVLASRECQDAAIWEGLMLDANGHVICGTRTNVFIVTGSRIMTPDLRSAGVRGVMRRLVLERAAGLRLEVAETDISRQLIESADDVFLTNALIGLRPVATLAARRYETGAIARTLSAELRQIGVGECTA